jgi:hypothetical protein
VRIKPKKITVQQLEKIQKRVKEIGEPAARKKTSQLNFSISPINKLSFTKAQKLIATLS